MTEPHTDLPRKVREDGRRYRQLIIDYLEKFSGASRKEINDFMVDEIRGQLSQEEKIAKITNLLTYMRRNGAIRNCGTTKNSSWMIIDKSKI